VLESARVIAVNTKPMHLASANDLRFSDNGTVVLCLAGDDTRLTPDAGIEIDAHRPGDALIVVSAVKGLVGLSMLKKGRVFQEFNEGALADDVPIMSSNLVLDRSEQVLAVALTHPRAGGLPLRRGCP